MQSADRIYMNRFSKAIIILSIFTFTAAGLFAFETGQASWYGGKFQGRKTANGEIFDTNKLTAAHKTLPFGTVVRVTNLGNNLHVDVRINDRGPFVEGRIIDLSRAAADRLEMTLSGVSPVKIEIISLPDGHTESELKKSDSVSQTGIPDSYKLQVASFSNAENAGRCLEKLRNNNIDAALELSSSGMIRVVIPAIEEDEADELKNKLKLLGFNSPLLRHN